MLFGPALDYDFLVGIELDGVAALAMEIAEEAVLPSAKWEVGHRRGDTDVDADISRGRFVAEAARGRTARREQRRLIAVGAAFEEGERLVHVVGVNEAQDWTEDLCVGEIAAGRNVVEDGGLHDVAEFVFRDLRIAAIHEDLRALLLADSDKRLDPLFALWRDDWTHLHAFLEAVSDLQFCGSIGDGIAKRLLRFADRHGHGDGEATLAGT